VPRHVPHDVGVRPQLLHDVAGERVEHKHTAILQDAAPRQMRTHTRRIATSDARAHTTAALTADPV
jgi:hypothetical protein